MAELQAIIVIFVHLLFLPLPYFTLPYLRIMKLKWLFFICTLFFQWTAQAQLTSKSDKYTYEDSLRGSITRERLWWDLLHYRLQVEVFPESKKIAGINTIRYQIKSPHSVMQIDLQRPMNIDSVFQAGKKLEFTRIAPNAYLITTDSSAKPGDIAEIAIYFSGVPKIAKNPPWDGGFTWKTLSQDRPFIATSCQGLGASVWWPCKDHMYDEPDSMRIEVTVPKPLMDVSNGRLEKIVDHGDKQTFHWVVKNPINNYGVNLNIAVYEHWNEIYDGENGPLTIDYFVLPENLEKAKLQFTQVHDMLKAFEHWFGPYPFYEDGYKLVEAPYLGMEHQSSVTYGNKFTNGYLGTDLSGTGWGKKWDYIIIHESGHEWFANNITYKDIADMWVHEGFTTYSEALFTEYMYGKVAGQDYVIGQRRNIQSKDPIIGRYNVNEEGSVDMYYKGANLLNMIRTILNDDEKWRQFLRDMNKDFYHQVVTSAQIENYMITKLGLPLQSVFDVYLRGISIPILECKFVKGKLRYRWQGVPTGFSMPVDLMVGSKKIRLNATTEQQSIKMKKGEISVDRNYYVKLRL